MLSWFDVAYAVLNIIMISYCFKKYFALRKKLFKLFGLGFVSLIISDFLWLFALIPWLSSLLIIYSYMRLGLYAVFILFVLRALQLSDSNPQAHTKQSNQQHESKDGDISA